MAGVFLPGQDIPSGQNQSLRLAQELADKIRAHHKVNFNPWSFINKHRRFHRKNIVDSFTVMSSEGAGRIRQVV